MAIPINRVVTIQDEYFEAIHIMCSNAKHVAPAVILILILCVLNTEQTLFSRKKNTTPAPTDNEAQQTGTVPQKETSHWWQIKFKPDPSEQSGSNQVTVSTPLIHQKLQSIFESHVNSDVKWVPCLCPMRKGENQLHQKPQKQHQNQQQQQPPPQHHQHQQQQQQQQHQQPQQQYGSSYYPPITTQTPSEIANDVPRFIITNYPIEA